MVDTIISCKTDTIISCNGAAANHAMGKKWTATQMKQTQSLNAWFMKAWAHNTGPLPVVLWKIVRNSEIAEVTILYRTLSSLQLKLTI